MRSLVFGDYMNMDAEGEDRLYEEVQSIEEFSNVVQLSLDEYNQTHKAQMNLVVFRSDCFCAFLQIDCCIQFFCFTCYQHRRVCPTYIRFEICLYLYSKLLYKKNGQYFAFL